MYDSRVGRTARAGQRGWSYNLVREPDAPYLLDLQLFLGKRLIFGAASGERPRYSEDVVVGGFGRDELESQCEMVSKMLDEDSELLALRQVASKGEKLYSKTRNAASVESARRAKHLTGSKIWAALHPFFCEAANQAEVERIDMLARVSGFRPQEIVFEIGKRDTSADAAQMKKRREFVDHLRRKKQGTQPTGLEDGMNASSILPDAKSQLVEERDSSDEDVDIDLPSDDELEVTISQTQNIADRKRDGYKDSEFFMDYAPKTMDLAEARGYGVHSGGNFNSLAASAIMDIANDDGAKAVAEPSGPKGMRWDKKSKKYVSRANDDDGSKGQRMITGESGQKIAASFRSGRFDTWRKTNRVGKVPRTGENENAPYSADRRGHGRFKHKSEKAPRDADKYRDDYHKRKRMVEKAKEERRGRFRDGKGKSELRGIDVVRKERAIYGRKCEKNARPGKRK